MKNKLFKKHASVIPTGAPTLRSGQAARSGGIPSFNRFLATLGMTALFCWSATAQGNGITVSNLTVEAGTITFNVSWQQPMPVEPWSDTVWVFVEYNDAGAMKRLPITSATATAGTVEKISGNDTGVRLIGNARSAGSFSATVQLLSATTATISGACAYASNYPPVGEYIDATQIKFTGAPIYKIVLENAGGSGTLTDYSDGSYTMREGYTIQSFTDATGAPGIMNCMLPATYTLQASASSFCAGSEGVRFALLGTENGRYYQLYRDDAAVDGAALEGNGNAATFTGSFNVAGAYTAWTVADEKYCAIAMSGTRVVVENPLPDNPTVNNNSRNCPGTVTLSASSPGATIDWYVAIDAASSVHTGTSYTTPEIDESTTYYVQAWNENTGCSSERKPVLAEVITEGCCHAPGATGVTFAAFNPCSHTVGSTYTLTDSRDQKTYKVKYMPDNRWWMVQDLLFGSCTGTTNWYTDNSAAATTHTPTVAPGYVGHCVQTNASGAGHLYNWPAVLQSINAYSGSSQTYCKGTSAGTASPNPASCQGICPPGWHVPTGNTDGEFKALSNALNCDNTTCMKNSIWEPTIHGLYTDSFVETGKSFYATSTYYDTTNMYDYGAGIGYSPGTQSSLKTYGFSVRCVMNY